MEKKFISVVLAFCALSFCGVPSYAEIAWPPPVYEMPRVVFDASVMDVFKNSIKASLGSISSTGIIILGITLSFSLIASIFLRLLMDKLKLFEGVWRNEFRRKVTALDRQRNMDAIVEDRVGAMEVSQRAKQEFRRRHPEVDINERIYQREVAFQADLALREMYPDRAFEEAVHRREIGAMAGIEFHLRNSELAILSGVARKEENHEAEGHFRYRNPNHVVDRVVDNRWISDEASQEYAARFPDRPSAVRFRRRRG